MPVPDYSALVREIIAGITQLGQRAILCGGWNEVNRDITFPPTVLFIKGAPHEWLMPRCCVAVHHGGAGTTAARYAPLCMECVCLEFGTDSSIILYFFTSAHMYLRF
mgnify:CR=1 FL=1